MGRIEMYREHLQAAINEAMEAQQRLLGLRDRMDAEVLAIVAQMREALAETQGEIEDIVPTGLYPTLSGLMAMSIAKANEVGEYASSAKEHMSDMVRILQHKIEALQEQLRLASDGFM